MSETPEEQPSTGVLGRIGSWLSPWRSKGPTSPSENLSPTSDHVFDSDGEEEEESQESVRPRLEEKGENSIPNPPGLSGGIFHSEGEDATQSGRRHSSALTAGRAPEEEEFVGCRKERTGQGKEREESSNGTSESGNPEKNASHLTHLSSSSEQGVLQGSDQAHTQPQAQIQAQAQTGRKKIQVYLEETNVFRNEKDKSGGQEVVTKVKTSLQVLPSLKSSQSFDSASSTTIENKKSKVTPADGTQSYYTALVGVSLKSHKDLEAEPDQEQTDEDRMGRKNASRRKYRKNSQGDGANTPQQEKMPPDAASEGVTTSDTTVTSPQGKSPHTHMGESSQDSSSKNNPSLQASPEGVEGKTSCLDSVTQLDVFQDAISTIPAAAQANVVDGAANMEDDESLYKVERKTETPESKRRSLKVSRSEVKFFPKNVPLNSKPVESQHFKPTQEISKDETKDESTTETDSRKHNLKKIDEESKTVVGRIADRISLFERPAAGGVNKQTFNTPRSADVSPVRKSTDQLKANLLLADQRSRSAERYDKVRSNSASPARDKPMTIKERMKNFTEASKAGERPALPQTPVVSRMSEKSTVSAASKSLELDNQGKLDAKQHKQVEAKTEIASKPDGQDKIDAGVQISSTKEESTDSKTADTLSVNTAEGRKPSIDETPVPDTSTELTGSSSPQSKGPSRAGSRSKRRKSKEPSSPISPNSENKTATKAEFKPVKTEQVDDKDNTTVFTEMSQENTSGKQALSDTKQAGFKIELKDFDKHKKESDSLSKKESIDKPIIRQGALPEPSVSRDETDTAACSTATKMPIDKEPVSLTKKEEKAGGLFMQEKSAANDSKETPSPLPEDKSKKTPVMEHEAPAKDPTFNKELSMQSNSESTEKETGKPNQSKNRDTEVRKQTESEGAGKLEKSKQAGSEEVHQLEKTETTKTKHLEKAESNKTKETASKEEARSENIENEKTNKTEKKQFLHSEESITKVKTIDSGNGSPGTKEAVVTDDERKKYERKEETQLVKGETKQENIQPEQASESPVKTSSLIANTQPKKPPASTVTHTNEAVTGNKRERGPSKVEMAENALKRSTENSGTEAEPALSAADPGPKSVSVEKTENSIDDSCAHGPNDAAFSSPKPITQTATAVEEVTVKASNDTPALITAQADISGGKESSVKDASSISVSKSVGSEKERPAVHEKSLTDKSVPSEVKTPGIITEIPLKLPQESKNTQSISGFPSPKGPETKAKTSSNSPASNTAAEVVKKKAEKTPLLSSIVNGEISPHSQLSLVKKEFVETKPSQTLKTTTSQEAKKQGSDSNARLPMKKLQLPRGLSKDDSSTMQDSPSSWLDVDLPKRKLKVSIPKLTSAGSESNLLDTPDDLDDEDFVEKIKKLCAPFSLPPRKHNPLRQPQPPFALPAIREVRNEKTFDPEEFQFGLRKKKQFSIDTTPSSLAKLQSSDSQKPSLLPARASLADRSLLLGGMDSLSRLREKNPANGDEDAKEEKEEQIKVKSRLEGSCVLSSLTSSFYRGKRNGVQTETEGTNSGNVSPSDSPQISPPPPPSPTAPQKDGLSKQIPALANKEEAQAGESVVGDSGPPLPSFNDIKLPDYLEKYLPREPRPALSEQGQEQVRTEATGKMATPDPKNEADMGVKPGLVLPDAPRFPGIPPNPQSTITELKQPPALPQGKTARGFHKRPGKMVLFEKPQFCSQAFEIYRDVADATSLQLSPLISVKVVRGCWVLYEKPGFQGRCIALEEGGIELANEWADQEPEQRPGTEEQNIPPMVIGSVRLAVWDYSLPRIDLFTEPEGRGRVTPYHDDTIETGSFGIPLSTASIQVHSGVWLVFSDPGFQGMIAVLETGVYPFPETWGFPSPFVGSIRPLKMGGFKVENPNDIKAVVYEKPGFEGACLETDSEVFSFCESEGDTSTDGENPDAKKVKSVGSLKISGGLWVGYSHPGFEGQQFILEEGEYLDCSDWGGQEQLLSLRPIQADFLSPHLKMFSDKNFGDHGVNIDISVPLINMEDTGYGVKTQSVDVISGVWVVFEQPGFCGESYILEKGLYGSPEDWGALQSRVAAVMPVVLENFENAAKFKVQLFSDPGFQGTALSFEDSVGSLQDGFSVASCKVLAGSWLVYEGRDFSGRMYVLEVGEYPDLRAMGCFNTNSSILSLQTVGFEFSLPSITVFERCGLRGKRVVLTDGSVNLQLAGGCSRVQSVLVEGGMWVLYEEINYRGAQILLKPGEVPDFHELSGWRKIGSLRPLQQKQVHFHLRNRQTKMMMSLTGDLDDVKLMRIHEKEETGGFEQIWLYQNGHLHCKMLEECCMSPSGSVIMAGSRVGLTTEPQNHHHLWSITPEGFIRYTPTPDLVLEVKGGHNYDKNQVILNSLDLHKLQQRWDVEII